MQAPLSRKAVYDEFDGKGFSKFNLAMALLYTIIVTNK